MGVRLKKCRVSFVLLSKHANRQRNVKPKKVRVKTCKQTTKPVSPKNRIETCKQTTKRVSTKVRVKTCKQTTKPASPKVRIETCKQTTKRVSPKVRIKICKQTTKPVSPKVGIKTCRLLSMWLQKFAVKRANKEWSKQQLNLHYKMQTKPFYCTIDEDWTDICKTKQTNQDVAALYWELRFCLWA